MKLGILIVDDEPAARFGMRKALAHRDYELREAAEGQAALDELARGGVHLVLLDLNMPGLDGQGLLRDPAVQASRAEIVVVSAIDALATAVECMRLGAADYLTKPFEIERLRAIARRAHHRLLLESQVAELQSQLEGQRGFGGLLGGSRPMLELYEQIRRAAAAPLDVLIRGETGTGKELIARELHRASPRAAGPLVAVNTAAIAAALVESELFGHVRGAFTGADHDRRGVFEQAHGGTLFLDEVGDMPIESQAKILRVLEERIVQPVGSDRRIPVDVRVISATHQDLDAAIRLGRFRQDLLYRIRGIELTVPSLRHRREDLVLLAEHFLARLAEQAADGRRCRLSTEAIERLWSHHWPGNVRELQQTVTAAASLCDGEVISASGLRLPASVEVPPEARFAELAGLPLTEAKQQLVIAFESAAIRAALEQHGGNISAAARQLGIHRQSLQQKMGQLGIDRPDASA